MEATIAAPVPPSQTNALPTQPLQKKNMSAHPASRNNMIVTNESLNRALSTVSPTRKRTTPTQDALQITVATAPQTPHATVVEPQETLPAVQDFLQKAYETVQLQNALKAAQASELNAVTTAQSTPRQNTEIVQDSLQKTANIMAIQTATVPFSQSLPSKSDTVTPASPSTSLAVLHTPDKNISVQIEQSKTPANMKRAPNANQSGQSSSASQIYFYNSAFQGKRFHQKSDPEKRSVLVAKRRNHEVPNKVKSSEIKQSSEVIQKSHSARASEKISNKNLVQIPNHAFADQNLKAENTPTTQSAQNPDFENSNISKNLQNTQSAQTSEAQSLRVSEKPQNKQSVHTPKESPTKHGNSRVAQTYQAFKYNQRSQNGPQTSAQSPRKYSQENQHAAGGSARSNGGWRQVPKVQEPELDPKKRVIVSGFPPYTKSQDLARVLSAIGPCTVDKCRNRLAVVTFEDEKTARDAIKASDEICIYGDFIEITPYTNPRHVDELFKAYKKVISTQKGQDIIQPSQIDLSGDFYQQMENIQNAIRLTREQVAAVSNLYIDLEMVLQQEWPGCVAIPFGSIPTGLGIKSSDADCYVQLPAGARRGAGGAGAAFVQRARRVLAAYPHVFTQLVAIPRANTPIVKFQHVPSGFHCDVSSKTPLGAQNSKLVKLLLECDARLAPVALLVKYWARAHALTGTGRLTNYALTLMVLFYLQRPPAALVPPVERLQRDPRSAYLVDHWNAGFAPPPAPAPAPCATAVPDLLGGFFQFYAAFDFDELVVCPFLGAPLRKAQFASGELPPELARYAANVRDARAGALRTTSPFCVQDPLEQSHNVASSVGAKLAADIRAYLRFAADAYAADRAAAGCSTFLRTALLRRPRLGRERATPTSKVSLIPRVRGDIVHADWRACVRNLVVDLIFDQILKIKLVRDPEREATERAEDDKKEVLRKKERERVAAQDAEKAQNAGEAPKVRREKLRMDREMYSGSGTKAVWRRRKTYTACSPVQARALVARQRAATEAALAAGAGAGAALRFELELGFHDEPRHCYVVARLLEGELNVFRGFVMFMHTAMFDWFRMLLRPHLARLPEPAPPARALSPPGPVIQFERSQELDDGTDDDADGVSRQLAADDDADGVSRQLAVDDDADGVSRRLAAVALAADSADADANSDSTDS